MDSFEDIFVLDIISLMGQRKFSGHIDITADQGDGQIRFAEGVPVSLGAGLALSDLLWITSGQIALRPSMSVEAASLETALGTTLELTSTQRYPAMPATCPLLLHQIVSRGTLKSPKPMPYAQTALVLYQRAERGMKLSALRGSLSEHDFWPAFFYSLASGQLYTDYVTGIQQVVNRFEAQFMSVLKSLLGTGAVDGLNQVLDNTLRNPKSADCLQTFDPIFGSAPFRQWVKTLGTSLAQISTATIARSCFGQSLQKLAAEDAAQIKLLIKA